MEYNKGKKKKNIEKKQIKRGRLWDRLTNEKRLKNLAGGGEILY